MTTTVVLPNWYHELQWAVAHPGPFALPYSWVDSVALEWSKESTAQALINDRNPAHGGFAVINLAPFEKRHFKILARMRWENRH